MKNKFLKKLIPVFLVILIIGTAIPLQVFAKDYEVKYHPDDWYVSSSPKFVFGLS